MTETGTDWFADRQFRNTNLTQWFSNFFACGPILLLQNNSGPQQFSKQKYYKKTNTEHLFQYNIYCKLAITFSGKDVLATQHIAFLFLVVYAKLPVSCDLAHQVYSSLLF